MERGVPPTDRGSRAVAPRAFVSLAGAALAALLAACADASGPAPWPGAGQARTITEADMRRWIALLSDDSMAGRGTPSPELDAAAAALAADFESLGLAPAFPGSFYQWYPTAADSVAGAVAARTPAAASAPNVAGLLEGRDPALKSEYVVFLAHLDHLGTAGRPGALCVAVLADSICNGADDNASGTAGVMELAEAFAGMTERPARSIIFLAVSGEEHGFWGSLWFLDHPPVSPARIVAAVNLDMIGRNARDSVLVGGLDLSTLGDAARAAAAAHAEEGMRPVVGPIAGSDHLAFYRRGIPFLVFFSGLHEDYHRPSDTVDRIDAEKAARIVRLAFYAGLAAANAPQRPAWHYLGTGGALRP